MTFASESDAPRIVADDGLHTPTIKPHSLQKLCAHNRFAGMFATAMRKQWPQLAYVGLYAGAGYARVADGGPIVETSALSVLQQKHGFTHYTFVENNADCVHALEQRCERVAPLANVTIVPKDVNESISEVRASLPSWSRGKGLLSFCFVDPFNTGVRFSTIRALADLRMDFLILLMLGVDTRRNFADYFHDPSSSRIGEFVECPNWREEYKRDGKSVRCVLRLFDEAMQRAGYTSARENVLPIYAQGTKVLQYMLAFYSKSPRGINLWKENLKSLRRQETQTYLPLD